MLSIVRTTSGVMNESYVVATTGRSVVLRRHRFEEAARVEREHDLTESARLRGIPTPPILRTRAGARVARITGNLYSIYELAPGRQIERAHLRPEHAASMGGALARIHAAIAGLTPAKPRRPSGTPPTAEETLTKLYGLRETIRSVPVPVESDRWAAERIDSRIAWLERHPEAAIVPEAVADQTVHGDYQESNVFFDAAGDVSAVIDWDKSERGSTAYEIIRTVALSFDLDADLCSEFMSAYRAVRPMQEERLEAAAARYSSHTAHDTWLYDTVYRQGDDRPRQFIRPGRFVPFLDRWRERGWR